MKNDLYTFNLPEELIAQTPANPRDHARLLVYELATGEISDNYFYNLPELLPKDATLVVNNSKVEQCRWLFDDGKTEIFVIEKNDPHTLRALVRPGKKFKNHETAQLTDWLSAKVLAIDDEGIRTLEFNIPHDDPKLREFEHIPLPPYIKQDDTLAEEYQTVFAKPPGSLAAPTAGLHFTEELIEKLRQNHAFAEITLHVGLGTFAKLTEDNLKYGRLHEEYCELSAEAADILNNSTHITAVGTTSVRTLETMRNRTHMFLEGFEDTNIFIRPGYSFKAVDSMITNFHLPGTSLLMLVAALIADKKNLSEGDAAHELRRIYTHAIEQKFRFYSFGDAMLLR